MLVTFSGIVSYAIYVYADADKKLDDKLFYEVVGYFFLGTFVLMAIVNGYLICKMKEKNKSLNQEIFGKEKKILLFVFLFFELSYLARFVWDTFYVYELISNHDYFKLITTSDSVFIIDGVSFGCLLLLHRRSFGKKLP